MPKKVIAVRGMSCGHCKSSIESALQKIGVQAQVNLELGQIELEDVWGNGDLSKIVEVIREEGYEPLVSN